MALPFVLASLVLLCVPGGPARADSILVGVEDDFGGGPDLLAPSFALAASLTPFGGCQHLDLVAGVNGGINNRQVAHTIWGLPPGIVAATLEIPIRGGDDPGVDNDGVFLSFVDGDTVHYSDAVVWRRSFGPVMATPPYYFEDDPGLLGEWGVGSETTLVLDLSALPTVSGGFVNLCPEMSRRGFLDVNVSDETGADWFRLTWTTGATDAPAADGRGLADGGLRCFPNPCRGGGTIAFSLGRESAARLGVYDVAGRLVRTLTVDRPQAREQRHDWLTTDDAGRALAPGTYFVRLETDARVESRRVVVLR